MENRMSDYVPCDSRDGVLALSFGPVICSALARRVRGGGGAGATAVLSRASFLGTLARLMPIYPVTSRFGYILETATMTENKVIDEDNP